MNQIEPTKFQFVVSAHLYVGYPDTDKPVLAFTCLNCGKRNAITLAASEIGYKNKLYYFPTRIYRFWCDCGRVDFIVVADPGEPLDMGDEPRQNRGEE